MTKQEFLAMSLPFGVYAKRAYLGTYKYHPLTYLNEFEVEKDNPAKECCLPILYPLSDLTKEIEHKGEKFVPINRIKASQCHLFFREDITSPLEGLQFSELRKLIEWHFDIADLISKGEAIDVNTLEINPYK